MEVVETRGGHDVFHLEASHEDVGDGADAVAPRRTPDEDVGEAGLALDAEEAVDARSSHVPTDEQRALPALREGEREVDDGRRLAFLEGRAGDDQDLPRAFHPCELDVRAERPVGFRDGRLRIEVRDQERVAQERLGIHLCEGGSALEDTLDRLARVDVRHHAEHRDLQVGFDVLDGADRGVERLLHEGEDQAERKAEQRANQDGVEGLGPDRRVGFRRRAHDRHFLDRLRLFDQGLLVLRFEQRQEVVVVLGLALQALHRQLDGRHLTVLLQQIAHLAIEDLLARAERRDLRRHLAPHFHPDLAQAVVERLETRVPVRDLDRQVVALEEELRVHGLELLHCGIRRVDEDALGRVRRVGPREARLDELELGALLAGLLDVAPCLGEQGEQHRRLGAGRDDAVGLAERPYLGLGPLDARLDLPELGLDELARFRHAEVPLLPVVTAVGIGDGVRDVARLPRVRGGYRDLEDARARDARHSDFRADRVQRRPVPLRLADHLARSGPRQLTEPLGDLLEDQIALDEGDLGLDVVRARVRQHLHQQARELGRLLEPHRRGGLVDRDLLPGEPEAEERDEHRRGDDDQPPPADDQPVVAEIHLVLRH